MHSRNLIYVVAAVGLVAVMQAVSAQDPRPVALPVVNTAIAPAAANEEPEMVFEREVFVYQGGNRRDPFKPLTDDDAMGPLFENLSLRMIIHSAVATESIVVLADNTGKTYRARRGQVVGNARIVTIEKDHVVFTVAELGNYSQEILELKPENK